MIIDYEIQGIDGLIKRLAPSRQDIILRRAVNKVGPQAKNSAIKAMKSIYFLKNVSRFKEKLMTYQGTNEYPVFIIKALKGKGREQVIPLYFRSLKQNKKGISVTIRRGDGFTVKGWYARLRTGKNDSTGEMAIFRRVGKNRYPIRQVTGPSPGDMLNEPRVRTAVERFVNRALPARVMHEIDYEMNRG